MFFILGRHDEHVPSVLAAEYFRQIEAPAKRLYWLERSGHYPPFEEPDVFNRILVQHIAAAINSGDDKNGIRYHSATLCERPERMTEVTPRRNSTLRRADDSADRK